MNVTLYFTTRYLDVVITYRGGCCDICVRVQVAGDSGSGSLVFVGVDGVQHPHLSFPPGDNILTFLTCLESALMPAALLSPSLSSRATNNRWGILLPSYVVVKINLIPSLINYRLIELTRCKVN